MKSTKAVTVEMIVELESRRHIMEYTGNKDLGLRRADCLLKKIIEFEKAGYFVPTKYGISAFNYKEMLGAFVRT